jgi:hypothetical protein
MLLLDADTVIVEVNRVVASMVSSSLDRNTHQRGGGGLGCMHSLENEESTKRTGSFSREKVMLRCAQSLGVVPQKS